VAERRPNYAEKALLDKWQGAVKKKKAQLHRKKLTIRKAGAFAEISIEKRQRIT
jgi:hypothetical protein